MSIIDFVLLAAVRGAPLLILAAVITRLVMQRNSATHRHLVWTAALAAQFAILFFGIVGPGFVVDFPGARGTAGRASASSAAEPAARGEFDLAKTADRTTVVVLGAAKRPAPAIGKTGTRQQRSMSFMAIARWIWLAGFLLMLARFSYGTLHLARVARDGKPVVDGAWLELAQRLARLSGMRRPLTLLKDDEYAIPVTWGFVYPIVLLPLDADSWQDERRRLVLLHEIAHVRRLDSVVQTSVQAALAVFWFNPLVWLAAHAIRIEREHACDDRVLSAGTSPSVYARELVQMLESYTGPDYPAIAALPMASKRHFKHRVHAILNQNRNRAANSAWHRSLAAGATLAVALPLAALTSKRAEPRPDGRATESSLADSSLLWSGGMIPGSVLNVRSWAGRIAAEESGSEYGEVLAGLLIDSSRVDSSQPLAVAVLSDGNDIVVCAMVSSDDECSREGYTPHRRPFRAWSSMILRIKVPDGVKLVAGTGDGEMTITAPASVSAQSGNGSISVKSRSGSVSASTGNGSIDARLFATENPEPMEFRTGNGTVTLAFPAQFGAKIAATLYGGELVHNLPLSVLAGTTDDGTRSYEVRLGGGGPQIRVVSRLGDLRIEQSRPGEM